MIGQVLRQSHAFQVTLPIVRSDIRVGDLTVQRFREFPGDPIHVLRPRTGEFVYPAQVRTRVGEYCSDYPSDISSSDRRGLALPKRQFDAASIPDARTGEEKEVIEEHRRPDCYDW